MADGGGTENSKLENHDYVKNPCNRCEGKDKHIESICYCETCQKHFCKHCRKRHDGFVKKHVVRDSTGGSEASSSKHGLENHEFCYDDPCSRCKNAEAECLCTTCGRRFCGLCRRVHDEFAVYHTVVKSSSPVFDDNHEVLCCAVNAMPGHRHGQTDSVPNITTGITKDELKDFNTKAQACLEKVRAGKQQSIASLNDSRASLKAKVTAFRGQVEEMLREMEKATHKNVTKLSDTLQQELTRCDKLSKDFQELTTQLSDDSISDAKRAEHGQRCADELNSLVRSSNDEIVLRLNTVLTVTKDAREMPENDIATEIKDVKNYRECKIRTGSDKKACDIQGICMLEDGTVIISDNNNEAIKRLDDNYNPVETCHMPASPHGVCCIDTKKVAVALGGKKKVQIVKITDKMRATEELTFKHRCLCIAYSNGMLYLTSGGLSPTIHEYYLTRGIIEYTCAKVRTFSDTLPRQVALSKDGNFVYVVGQHDKLLIRNRNGGFVQAIDHPNMKKYGESPGVCVDSKGNVLVSLQFAGILQFSNFGTEPNGMLLKNGSGTTQPELAFVDHLRSKLLIQRNKVFGGSDTMDVWDLVYH